MGKLIIIRGNSGSGKTTLARALQAKFGPGTMLISHDLVRLEMLHVHGAEGVARSEPLMIHLLRYGAEHAAVTIMEGILPAKKYSRLFETAVCSKRLRRYSVRIFLPVIMICPLTKPCAGTGRRMSAMNSARRKCADGGWRRIFCPAFPKRS